MYRQCFRVGLAVPSDSSSSFDRFSSAVCSLCLHMKCINSARSHIEESLGACKVNCPPVFRHSSAQRRSCCNRCKDFDLCLLSLLRSAMPRLVCTAAHAEGLHSSCGMVPIRLEPGFSRRHVSTSSSQVLLCAIFSGANVVIDLASSYS